jgi:cation diffusion facilitator family transporter
MSNSYRNKKVKTARLSIISNSFLIILKVIAGVLSGSVSIISEAIHSGLDLVAALIAFFAVRVSDKPADDEHPFGHGKYENVSGVVEALLIFGAAIWIIFEAVSKIVNRGNILDSGSLNIGIVVMFLSGVVNYFISRRLYKVAKETSSLALEADALHLKTDIYTSVGVGFGLLAIKLTGLHFLDPLIALLVAIFIIYEAYQMLIKAFSPLIDSSLGKEELFSIVSFIKSEMPSGYKCSEIKTRKSGALKIIQFKLIAEKNYMLKDAIQKRNKLISKILDTFPESELIVQLEYMEDNQNQSYE